MPYVAITVGGGMGNQLFMTAAVLGYAERNGYTPVFWEEPDSSWEHKGSRFRVKDMFGWRVLTEEERREECIVLREPTDAVFTYIPIPMNGKNLKLEGYFQSDLYGPSTFPTPPSPPLLTPELISHKWSTTFFLHVRRGDYMHPANANHAVDLSEYWRTCLREIDPSWTCFVVSDDIEWCERELLASVASVAPIAWKGNWLFCPRGISDVETFFWMLSCDKGGICANSTFSWWAAWYLRRRVGNAGKFYMPRDWGNLPPRRNLYPSWVSIR